VREGTRFFEEFIGTPYPWSKIDQIFCPEYRIGAMENVGCITFTDNYLKPKNEFSEFWKT
jgi:aminopeptidase N